MSHEAASHTRYWVANSVAALVILVILGVHMGLIHLDGLLALLNPAWADALAWPNVVARGSSGWFTATYILLVASALFHGLYGLYNMLTEIWTSPRAAARLATGCWICGLVLFAVGTTATLMFYFQVAGS